MKRGFLAIIPPDDVLDAIDHLLERPKSSTFTWTRRDQWHVTLQFYGRVDDPAALCDGIAAAAAASGPMQIAVRGGGAFPTPKKAQIFWLGIDGCVAAGGNAEATGAGIDAEERTWTPFCAERACSARV